MKRVALFAAVAALSVGAYALPTQAATVTVPKAEIGASHAITQIGCVIRVHRHFVPRHVRPDGRDRSGSLDPDSRQNLQLGR